MCYSLKADGVLLFLSAPETFRVLFPTGSSFSESDRTAFT